MDDFQKDFMRKVKNPTLEGEVVDPSGARKKPLDKRWFIIGGLILALGIILIILLVISNSNSDTNNSTSKPEVYKSDIIGQWQCDNGTALDFYTDKTYMWTNQATDSAESGNFTNTSSTLTLERLSRVVNGDFATITQKTGKYNITFGNNTVILRSADEETVHSCTRSNDV